MPVRTKISQHEVFRRHKGLSVTGLADRLGCSHTYVSLVEGARQAASPKYRKALTALLGVDEGLVFDEEGWAR